MGFLDDVKRAFNIGGCKLVINTNGLSFPQGTPVEGTVHLEGGGLDQNCSLMSIELEEFWTESRGSGKNRRRVTVYRTREREILGRDISILPGDRASYEFQLNLPSNSRLSTSTTGWRLKVSLDIPGAIDPSSTLILKVTGAAEFKAISAACSELFQMREKENSWKWDDTQSTYFRLLPSEEMSREFDYIAFSLHQIESTGGVRGKIIFNLQEKSFKDYLKAMLFMDRIEKPLLLSREQLFSDAGTVNCSAIQGIIEPVIREIVQSRNQYDKIQNQEIIARQITPGTPLKSAIPSKKTQKEFDPRALDDYCNK
jgi:sporulation-control protein spo0M